MIALHELSTAETAEPSQLQCHDRLSGALILLLNGVADLHMDWQSQILKLRNPCKLQQKFLRP